MIPQLITGLWASSAMSFFLELHLLKLRVRRTPSDDDFCSFFRLINSVDFTLDFECGLALVKNATELVIILQDYACRSELPIKPACFYGSQGSHLSAFGQRSGKKTAP
ncbi:hypothetical protein H6P81_014254 [Aristolochia fimbriata]|uniref:Uncharacterized protein n=1 Tax=Aristolochia fimbriata TaxID=158543 RepID=A0AAV7EKA9_ARIFI|nr:hypothetical protein H6P81_014254 [Aristolochia fimbriata]